MAVNELWVVNVDLLLIEGDLLLRLRLPVMEIFLYLWIRKGWFISSPVNGLSKPKTQNGFKKDCITKGKQKDSKRMPSVCHPSVLLLRSDCNFFSWFSSLPLVDYAISGLASLCWILTWDWLWLPFKLNCLEVVWTRLTCDRFRFTCDWLRWTCDWLKVNLWLFEG